MIKQYSFLGFFILFISITHAQSIDKKVFANSGDEISNTNNRLSFTIGEPIIGVKSGVSNTIHQGFWNAVISITLSESDFNIAEKVNIKVFPNPVQNFVKIKFDNSVSQEYHLFLFDINGKIIKQKKIHKGNKETQIKMTDLSIGTYILKIKQKNSDKIITYKLIKND